MAYEKREHLRNVRYTIRAQAAKDELIRAAAKLIGVQPSTFIYEAALRKGEEVLQQAGVLHEQKSNA
ncbi:DUF1778 domain-containing protein [Paracidovorax valerianellae]|uniref:type II toxin -antitoxin system TacA 1-like antitoxin n=1 Tax=Paracidovorax valerianellae TaxID=187868 RepID=UPI0023027B78|nr:DUF1778 domain-containing protein [Paracidovorax valerianellae]MDA8444781.1 DUF1778 domain-containing protein [Paracidovorax valerianellae]